MNNNKTDTGDKTRLSDALDSLVRYSRIRFWTFFLEGVVATGETEDDSRTEVPEWWTDLISDFTVEKLRDHDIDDNFAKDRYPKAYDYAIKALRDEIDEASLVCRDARIEVPFEERRPRKESKN